jgi:prepilin-type N-terminal cleavage/methylation domain-containing protein
MKRGHNQSHAFTLIELLVVIAVIMLLAALAMPAMEHAINLSHRVGCISNMRQMYACFATYSNNNSNLLPNSAFEYFRLGGYMDTVPGLRPYVPDPRVMYCTMTDIGLPNIDTPGAYAGWNRYGDPGMVYILSNIARFHNPYNLGGSPSYGGYDGNLWAIGSRWRHPRAALFSHRRVMRFGLTAWDPSDWRCQNWYPHSDNYHDVLYGDGRNEGHNDWKNKPRLWYYWGGSDQCHVFF